VDGIDRLAGLLVAEKRFRPICGLDFEQAPLLTEPAPFNYFGTRAHWGSNTAIGLVQADALDPAAMKLFARRFHELLYLNPGFWIGGSYGLLGFAFDRPPPAQIVDGVRKLKRFNVPDKVWMAAWTLDLSTGRVTPHSGGPYGLYPGRAWMEKAIRRS